MEVQEFYRLKKKLEEENITLVAVSKTKPAADIQRLYNLGQRDFGENYVQELLQKQSTLPEDIHWHFIGHLQRNKVKYIAPFCHLIQSVDSENLLAEIDKQGAKNNRLIRVLLQVHIASEETKFGFDADELKGMIGKLALYKNVAVEGLMGMATFSDDPKIIEREFAYLKTIFDDCNAHSEAHWKTLSMGMSADYQLAIEHGSNMVRLGSLLFGSRNL